MSMGQIDSERTWDTLTREALLAAREEDDQRARVRPHVRDIYRTGGKVGLSKGTA